MPADPTGVSTDDHGPGGNGAEPAPNAARSDGRTHGDQVGASGPAPSTDPSAVPDPPVLSPPGGGADGGSRSGSAPTTPAVAGSDGAPTQPAAPVADPAAGLPPRRRDPLGPAQRRVRGRHAARDDKPPRTDRASRRGLRVDQRLWSIDPWSVFKVSALFFFCLGLIILVAGTLLYNAGRSVGTIDQFESFVTRMGAYGECVPTAEVPAGTEFREDTGTCDEGEVLVGGFVLDDALLFRAAAIGGTILVVAGSVGTVLLTVLVNLLNEVTGGLRHTIVREPVTRPAGPYPARRPTGNGARDGGPRGGPEGAPPGGRDGGPRGEQAHPTGSPVPPAQR